MHCKQRRLTRPSFVLLIVVMLLAVTCIVLYQISAIAMRRVGESVRHERELQKRWSIASLRRSLLPQAGQILVARELAAADVDGQSNKDGLRPVVVQRVDAELLLNGDVYQIALHDESSKFAAATAIERNGSRGYEAVSDILTEKGLMIRSELQQERQLQQPVSWRDIVFGSVSPTDIAILTEDMTLWGDGKLSVYRSSDRVFERMWFMVFGRFPPTEIIETRQGYPRLSFQELKTRLDLREDDQRLFDSRFTDRSRCFSLFIHCLSEHGETGHTMQFVLDREALVHALEY